MVAGVRSQEAPEGDPDHVQLVGVFAPREKSAFLILFTVVAIRLLPQRSLESEAECIAKRPRLRNNISGSIQLKTTFHTQAASEKRLTLGCMKSDFVEGATPTASRPLYWWAMTETVDNIENQEVQDQHEEVSPEAIVEALLMSSDDSLSGGKIAQILGVGTASDVKNHVEALNERYEREGASFRVELIAKGYQIMTQPTYDRWISKLFKARSDSRLSPALLETLAIVAYKQPVLRAEVEAVRGVACGEMLSRLRDVNLARIVGRAEEIGRPLLYGTTTKFLEVFGLSSLKDLPKIDDDKADSIPALKAVPAEGPATPYETDPNASCGESEDSQDE